MVRFLHYKVLMTMNTLYAEALKNLTPVSSGDDALNSSAFGG